MNLMICFYKLFMVCQSYRLLLNHADKKKSAMYIKARSVKCCACWAKTEF